MFYVLKKPNKHNKLIKITKVIMHIIFFLYFQKNLVITEKLTVFNKSLIIVLERIT